MATHEYTLKTGRSKRYDRIFVTAAILLVLGSAFWAARVTQAEFEVPLVDTTDFVPTTFQSVWTYNRQTSIGGTSYKNYEGFAVGTPTQPTQDGTTALYKFNGDVWEKILPQGTKTISGDYQLNAVAGQYYTLRGYSSVNVVGKQANTVSGRKRQAFIVTMMNYPKTLGSYKADATSVGQTILNNYTHPDSPTVAFFRKLSTNLPFEDNQFAAKIAPEAIPANSELYAIGTAPNFLHNDDYGHRDGNLAGGQNGWLATVWRRFAPATLTGATPPPSCYSEFIKDASFRCSPEPTYVDTDFRNKQYQESWYLYQLNDADAPVPGSDNITGITYVNENTAYVTTSTFREVSTTDAQPKTPFARDCSNSMPSNTPQTSKLFKVIGDVTNVDSWTKVNATVGECFYGLTATVRDQASANGGPLVTDIWIASSKGIRQVTDGGTSSPSLVWDTTTDEPDIFRGLGVYGVTSNFERSGSDQQLLLNGTMNSWTLGASSADPLNKPAGWQFNGLDIYKNYAIPVGGGCRLGYGDVMPVNRGGGNWAVKIEPALQLYTISSSCGSGFRTQYRDRYVGIQQVVPLSSTEGTKYRVSGSYKVTYTDSASWFDPLNPTTNYKPLYRQAGVMTTCLGANRRYLSQTTQPPYTVDCSLTNKQEIRTLTSGADTMGAYKDFSFIVSRVNNQLSTITKTGPGLPIPNGETNGATSGDDSLFMVVECVASYGTSIECDNIKVEEISDPLLPPRSVVKVLAVGQNGLTLRNDDANNPSSPWTIDDTNLLLPQPTDRATLHSVFNAGGDHIFAAGSSNSLFQRTSGNVNGYAWLGAAQPSDGSPPTAALGWLATNCVNLRDAAARTLCKRQAQSFGLSLSLERDNVTEIFSLSGRAWFAKQLTDNSNRDNEGLDLGVCKNPARNPGAPASQPYNMTGSCNTTTRTCVTPNKVCSNDKTTSCTVATAIADCGAGNTCIDVNKACLTNFDCFGRCSGDTGYICLSDGDCVGTALASSPQLSSPLDAAPALNLTCNGLKSSPNTCSAAGWLTFNANDLPTTPINQRTAPDGGTVGVTLNQSTGGLSGWSRFMTLANTDNPNYQANQGWVKFRGDASVPTGTKLYAAQNCSLPSGNALRCSNNINNDCSTTALSTACTGLGGRCVNYAVCKFGYDQTLQSCRPGANTCTNFCDSEITNPNPPTQACTSDAECVSVWGVNKPCKPVGYCSTSLHCSNDADISCTVATAADDCGVGNTCVSPTPTTRCDTNKDCGTPGSFCMFGSICNVGAPTTCNAYGVDFDETKGKFQGFAWSAENGWIDFRGVQKGNTRYLQTRLGDIYTRGDISSASGAICSGSATYLISASGNIGGFCSDLAGTSGLPTGFEGGLQTSAPEIPFSSADNAFSTALGRFDLTGIETVTSGGQNKYLQTVTALTPAADGTITLPVDGAGQIALNRVVYTVTCPVATGNTCKLTQALKIRNADPLQNGAGILVVNGNLTITNNLQYVSSQINDLRSLASLVVVVRGNLNIENPVTNLVGAYYVDGTVFTSPEADKDKPDNHYPLTVRGLMIARQFIFNRKFAGTVESPLPSELFIFDGRLQSNPLPGMVDFGNALPNTLNSSP